jgi:predicted DNA-binding transcriptional regulator YafY
MVAVLPSAPLRDLMTLSAEELAALDLAVETLKRSGLAVEADDLLGLARRSWPSRQRFGRKIVAAIAEAIKACRIVEVTYQSRGEPEPRSRRLAPYGLLTGIRRYLVARRDDNLSGKARLYVVENIRSARVSADPFTRDPEFNLQDFARRSFGVFQHPEEYGEVVWRFSPKAAAQARGFEFHPSVRATRPGALLMIFSGRLNTRCRALRKSG